MIGADSVFSLSSLIIKREQLKERRTQLYLSIIYHKVKVFFFLPLLLLLCFFEHLTIFTLVEKARMKFSFILNLPHSH